MLVFYDKRSTPAKLPVTPAPQPSTARKWQVIAIGLLLGLVIWAYLSGYVLPPMPFGGAQ